MANFSISAKVHEAKTLYTVGTAAPGVDDVELRVVSDNLLSHRQLRSLVMKMLDEMQERKEPKELSAR